MDRAHVCSHRECWENEVCTLHPTHHHFKVAECAHGKRGKHFCQALDMSVPTNECRQEDCPVFEACMSLDTITIMQAGGRR